MSQVDDRNPSTAKRARTDGGRREDDWTCPGCGNVNFSFRTTCNMHNCNQPRPADHNVKSAMKPMQPPPFSFAAPYGCSGAPSSSMYMGMLPYGSSVFSVSSMPPYDVPFSGRSAYHYNFAGPLSGGSPYQPLPLLGPPPYSAGMYGMPPPMMAPPPMCPRPGFFPDDKSQKKDVTRDNDWVCPICGNVNFSFRTVCNVRKCRTPKPGSQGAKSEKNSKQKIPQGSWKCEKCGNINYPFRTKCNRQNCRADKPSEEKKSPSLAADGNEQGCKKKRVLFASRSLRADGSYEIHVEATGPGPEQLVADRNRTRFEVLNLIDWRDCHRNSEGQLCYSESPYAGQLYHHLDAMYTEDKEAVWAAKQELDLECAEAALKDYNGKHGTQYELVEVLGRCQFHHKGLWFHLNFIACDSRLTEVFFAELHFAGAFDVKSCCILTRSNVVGGCEMCESYIKHPVGGFDFPDFEKMLAAHAAAPPFLGSVRSLMASTLHTFPRAY